MNHTTYPDGQCTRYVADNWSDPVGPYWGNAVKWLGSAQADGYHLSPTPVVGRIAVWGANMGGTGPDGHVAIVTSVSPLVVSESNWNDDGKVGSRAVPAWSKSGIMGYIVPKSQEVSTVNYLLSGPPANNADALARRIRVHEWVHMNGSQVPPGTLTPDKMTQLLNLWIAQGAEAVFAAMFGA